MYPNLYAISTPAGPLQALWISWLFLFQAMEVPRDVRTSMVFLMGPLKQKGIFLHRIEEEYEELVEKELNYKSLGFKSLEDLILAMPDILRQVFCHM